MAQFPVFLSLVLVVHNQAERLASLLREATDVLAPLASDYELIIIDNASTDESAALLKKLTEEDGLPNLQVYILTRKINFAAASWAGLENALGDYVAVIDPLIDDIHFLPAMMEKTATGSDIVFALNEIRPKKSIAYRLGAAVFNLTCRLLGHAHLIQIQSEFRILSREVVNFVLQHARPEIVYRHLQSVAGFSAAHLSYRAPLAGRHKKTLRDSMDRGIALLVSATHGPMRLVAMLCLFGASMNLLYSIYIVGVWLFQSDVAPGWVTLSLQQSGMFFLISITLLVLSEYILYIGSLTSKEGAHHIGREFSSFVITHREKLNVVDVSASDDKSSHQA